MNPNNCDQLIHHILNLVEYNIETPFDENTIINGSGLNSTELKFCLNYLKSKGLVIRDEVVPITAGDPYDKPIFYKLTTKALDVTEPDKTKNGDTYNVHFGNMSNSNAQVGNRNVMEVNQLQIIGSLLDQISICLDRSDLVDSEKSRGKSIVQSIKSAVLDRNLAMIKSGLQSLYGLINNTTSCIVLAAKIPEVLSQLSPS